MNQMNQMQKTSVFLGIAVLAVILAIEPWRSLAKTSVEGKQVTKLFADFVDPAVAQSLQIIKFDETMAQLRQFSIQKENGQWVIPSHASYPADAREHMAAAAVSLMDLESLSMPSSSPGDFETYGVIDPDMKSLKVGSVGVGMRVTMKDVKDKVLADLIIGKEPKDQPELRYVRVADHDQVYVVKLKTDKLSTKFEDWIEKDLLKLNAFDIRQLELNDYSIEQELGADGSVLLSPNRRSKMKLAYDDEKAQWSLADFITYKKGSPVSAKLKDDEELNTEKLNGLKSALDDLQIVDVQRKPKGLSQDLRATEDFVNDREAAASLQSKGFFALRNDKGGLEIYSTEGEVLCMMKDGVEYVLRFGNVAAGSGDEEPDPAEDGKKDKGKISRLNRYLFVSCVLHEDLIPKPQLEELPPEPAAEAADGEKPAVDGKAANAKEDAKPEAPPINQADSAKPVNGAKPDSGAKPASNAKPGAAPAAPPKPTGKQASADKSPTAAKSAFRLTAADETAVKKSVAAAAADAPAASSPAAAKPADDKEAMPADAAADDAAGGKIRAKARDAKVLAEKRASIEKENKHKTDEYNEKLKKAQEHAKELNDRFADWYYVISDDVYHKIHLSRGDIVKKKEKPEGKGDGLGDFKALQKGLPGHDHDHDQMPAAKPPGKKK